MADQTTNQTGQTMGEPVNEEIGRDEAWFANVKRTYDEYQQESLESIKRNRTIIDKMISDAQQYDNQRQAIANQALQNAVESANMVSKNAITTIDLAAKQSVRHSDIAIDRQWNVDEQGYTAADILQSGVFSDAIAAAVSKAVQDAVATLRGPTTT